MSDIAPSIDGEARPSSGSSAKVAEFRSHWRALLAVVIGLSTGAASTLGYSHGALIGPLEAEYGWSRSYLSLGITAFGLAVLLGGARWGALSDRFGARRVAVLSLLVYGTLLASAPDLIHLLPFWLIYFITSIAGTGATAAALTKPINDNFFAARGIALGVAFAGIGLGAFWVPLATQWLIEQGGWRFAYHALGAMSFAAAPIVWFLLGPSADAAATPAVTHAGKDELDGLTLHQAARTRTFWLLIILGTALTLGIVGMTSHLIPLFHHAGASPARAVAIASILGLASMAARLLVGFALDRARGPIIAVLVPIVASAGILLLLPGPVTAPFAVLLIGLAFGSEIDMIAYFTSRYFGHREFGAIYGWMFGVFGISGGCASYLSGAIFDHFGSYHLAILACVSLTALAALLATRLGPYRFETRHTVSH
ncbi:MFS transporter [Sphingomonas naphthae]|uniref:MFS transporter n=1 Tax=Sphingomonas naphthae TaxID=1813468 RepID=A0ABY7TQR6_9SPHN|nr:MFS transporter [Sphingomonas naphthae]WCT74519.1 MFS transporter [Sphingomonas naphthae]